MKGQPNLQDILKQTENLTERINQSITNFKNQTQMKTSTAIIKPLTLLLCAILMISCTNDDAELQKTEPTEVNETKTMSESLIGEYKSVYGSENPGSITIYEGVVHVYTVKYSGTFKIDYSQPYFNPDCFIKIKLSNGEILHLSLFRSIDRIQLSIVYKNGSEESLDAFDKPKEEPAPTQPEPQEPVFN